MKLKYLFLILSLFTLVSCKEEDKTTTAAKTHYYDPKIPGGQIVFNTTGLSGKVLNLTADNSQLNKITLNWTVPPIYKTMNYTVNVYKKRGSDPFTLPDPADEYSAAYLYLRSSVVGESFIDQDYLDEEGEVQVEVEQNNIYNYWVYIKVKDGEGIDRWSSGVKITVTSKAPTDTFTFPDPSKFWENLRWSIGNGPTSSNNPNPVINVTTLDPGQPGVGNPVGNIAVAYSGNLMYVSDTKNNRIVIFTRGEAHSCDQWKNTDEALYYACTYQYSGYPFAAKNVLGQTSPFENKTCAEHEISCSSRTTEGQCSSTTNFNSMCTWFSDSNVPNGGTCSAYERCLTKPGKLTVADNKLFVADAGNNRIVVYSQMPVKGHLRDASGTGLQNQTIDGSPDMVIGKKNLRDQTLSYPLGRSSLNQPAGVAVKGSHLYIADMGNNRIVKIQNYKDQNSFLCNDENDWDNLPTDLGGGNGKCKFSGVLGQKDYYQKWSLKDGDGILAPGDVGFDGITCTNPTPSTVSCVSPYVISVGTDGALRDKLQDQRMGRYFRKPVQIAFTSAGHMLVAANEEVSVSSPLGTSQIRGRILVWDQDPMTDLPNAEPNKCNAGWFNAGEPGNNFDNTNFCQASSVIGQETGFIKLIIVPPGGKYNNNNFALDSIDGFSMKSSATTVNGNPYTINSIFGVDSLNNSVYYWKDFIESQTSLGNPPTAKVLNPNGALNSQTGTYLPILQSIADINVTENNLIYISDPKNYKIYEVRAYNYETAQ